MRLLLAVCLLHFAQVVLDLCRSEHLELLVRPDDANLWRRERRRAQEVGVWRGAGGEGGSWAARLDVCVVHRAFEALLEREQRGVDGVLELELVVVPSGRDGEGGGGSRRAPSLGEGACGVISRPASCSAPLLLEQTLRDQVR